MYQAHRLAWLYIYGKFPEHYIDHINGNKSYNRISNLREATASENNRNSILRKDSTSKVKGVHWCNRQMKWVASIKVDNKSIYLGSFSDLEKAKEKIMTVREKIHKEFTNHGGES